MTTQYGNGNREPSAGVVSRAVHGAGKLSVGTHDLEVLAIPEYATHLVVLLSNPAGHVHSEAVVPPLPAWLHVGARVKARVGVGPGFVVVRDVDRFQGRDSVTREPLTEWTQDLGELYDACRQRGVAPATTQLVEVCLGEHSWQPVLHLPEARRPTASSAPATDPAAPRTD